MCSEGVIRPGGGLQQLDVPLPNAEAAEILRKQFPE